MWMTATGTDDIEQALNVAIARSKEVSETYLCGHARLPEELTAYTEDPDDISTTERTNRATTLGKTRADIVKNKLFEPSILKVRRSKLEMNTAKESSNLKFFAKRDLLFP
jgi:hypothetical protein